MRVFKTLEELASCAGQELGVSPWHTITQQQIDAFAKATLDQQWIHVNEERAKTGPFKSTIAHGFLTLSLMPWCMDHQHQLWAQQSAFHLSRASQCSGEGALSIVCF